MKKRQKKKEKLGDRENKEVAKNRQEKMRLKN